MGKMAELRARLASCDLCPRECRVNRLEDERGVCRVGRKAIVSSYGPHFGEEPVLVGRFGSGTIFFSGCNLKCCFCQNYEISQLLMGKEVEKEELARLMLELKRMGCHNINLVSPTHVIAQIIEALPIAIDLGLDLPIVYNSGGYDSVSVLRLLEGIIDIYMPDAKYGDDEIGEQLSGVKGYWRINREALREMHRQVGDLVTEEGIAQRGMLIRHLVLPDQLAGSERVLRFIAQELSPHSYVNIMDQYRPCYLAHRHPSLSRRITRSEYDRVVTWARSAGLTRLLC